MIIAQNSKQLIAARTALKGTVALVTTMGNLHQGHLSLVERAKSEADHVIATIYINPLQFSANEDLNSYPRTLDEDMAELEALGVDLLFTPSDADIYPDGVENHTQVVVPSISYMYCGEHRKGHFIGVTTVVNILFNLTKPDVAIFGNKDFQQLTIIQKMVTDLAMTVKLIGMPTYREDSGLAMSSRNRYLDEKEKLQASALYENLKWAEQQLKSGNRHFRDIENDATRVLEEKGFNVEFFTICRQESLIPASEEDTKLVILAGTKFGKPRLIDNITVDLTTTL